MYRIPTDSSRNSPSRQPPSHPPPQAYTSPRSNGYGAQHQYSPSRYQQNGNYQAQYQSTGVNVNDDEDFTDETAYFEKNRIKQLQDERVHIQKKTFTKWCNSYLNKVSLLVSSI